MTDELLDRVRAWTYGRQLLAQPAESALSALCETVAVYSSHPSAPLSLLARTSQLDEGAFLNLEQERLAVRLPAMRGSIFLVPTEFASNLLAATRTPIEKLSGRLEYAGFTWNDYEQIKQRVLAFATEPVSTDDLQAAIATDGKLMVAVRMMAYEGLMLRIGTNLRSDRLLYVSTVAWLGQPLEERDPEESLRWLASVYLRSYGPARSGDFAWWAGISKLKANEAVAKLAAVDIGEGLFLLEEDLSSFNQQAPLDEESIVILPKWDAYTMAYAMDGRARFIDDEQLPLAYAKVSATSGDGLPVILRGGKAIATWSHRFQRDRLAVTLSPFEPGDKLRWLDERHFKLVAALLGADRLDISIDN